MAPKLANRKIDWLIAHKDIQQDECLIWPFAKDGSGYGIFGTYKGYGTYKAHIAMCELVYGPPPIGKSQALHKCNIKLCVLPKHLYWGNDSDNRLDDHKERRSRCAKSKICTQSISKETEEG